MMFSDRRDAGRLLAARLLAFRADNPVILALPRGGVPVAYEIAHALAAPLDLVLVRKIGAPRQPEYAIGAIADGPVPELVTDAAAIDALDIPAPYLASAKATALAEIERRRAAYLGDRAGIDVAGRVVIVVDDGIATGATMRAALRATRQRKPSHLIMAVPVAAPETIADLRREADEIVCLHIPEELRAVGFFYRDFTQTTDQEVIALLAANRAETKPASP
jgi:putative phosphoribosyl transferase